MRRRGWLWIRNWDRWQTYHRASPPWIKLHRRMLRDHDLTDLTNEQRGQLIWLWLLAADNGGSIPDDAEKCQKLCQMDTKPNLKLFEGLGFLTKTRRQHVALETETETEADTDKNLTGENPTEDNVIHPRWDRRGRRK